MRQAVLAVSLAFTLLATVGSVASSASTLWFVCGSSDICRSDERGGQRRVVVRHESVEYESPAVSRSGDRLAFSDGRDVFVSDPTGRRRVAVTKSTDPECCKTGQVQFRNDGRRLLWTQGAFGGERLCTSNTTGTDVGCRAFNFETDTAGWGPGNSLLGSTLENEICIRMLRECGRVVARTRPGYAFAEQPELAPTGRLLLDTTYNGSYDLVVYDTRTAKLIRTLGTFDQDLDPVWSPDGRWVAFDLYSRETRLHSVYRMPARGGPMKLVARDAATPAWSR